MTEQPEGAQDGGGFHPDVSRVEVWTTAKGLPQWKVRVVTDEDQAKIDLLVSQGVAAYQRLERELRVGGAPAEGWPGE